MISPFNAAVSSKADTRIIKIMEGFQMKNLKSFLFKSKSGSFFVLSVVIDGNRKLHAKILGSNILPNKDFINIYSVNYMTEWLCNNGNTYIKRLPVIAGSEYNERQLREVLGMFRHLKVS